MLVEKRANMAATPEGTKNTAQDEKDVSGPAHYGKVHPGADRANLLIAVRQAEASAAKRREAVVKRAEGIKAEGRKAAIKLAEESEKEGRALVKAAVAKALKECELARAERLAKADGQASSIAVNARGKYPELAKKILQELERGEDAKD